MKTYFLKKIIAFIGRKPKKRIYLFMYWNIFIIINDYKEKILIIILNRSGSFNIDQYQKPMKLITLFFNAIVKLIE